MSGLRSRRPLPSSLAVTVLALLVSVSAAAVEHPGDCRFRVATYNVSLNFPEAGGIVTALRGGAHEPARRVAAVIQAVRPDILLLNEVDHDPAMDGLSAFVQEYLAVDQAGQSALRFDHAFHAPVNTGVPSGHDLDGDGSTDGPGDAWGFGRFPGQYGMAVLSRHPIDGAASRTFQRFPWVDLPGASLPKDPSSGAPFYPPSVAEVLRLSSKSHWDVVVRLPNGRDLHLLASHPTPPVFDGPEDRNGLRNRDEIGFWRHYIDGHDVLLDDQGRSGGLPDGASFVIVGDLNADPNDGDSTGNPITALLEHPRVNGGVAPASAGAAAKAILDGGANASHRSPPETDTGDFGDRSPGNLRIDYVLPSSDLTVLDSGVFWPLPDEPGADWIDASDHRLVWVDLACRD